MRSTSALAALLALMLAPPQGAVYAATPKNPASPPPTPQTAAALALPPGVEAGPSIEGISEYRLPNGLRVLLFPDPTQPTITVNVTYLVGSRVEDYGETGMAHLLEHLMFKGSERHRDIPHEMQERGGQSNASTWYDRTNYFEVFQASDANLDWALDLEADRMVHSFIAKKDLDSEMTVVRNEFEMGENSPREVVEERAMETAYIWHSYGKPTIGARSDIENVPIERLQAFYRRYYQPDNAVLLVAGQIDPARTLAKAAQTFGSIPRPERKLPAIYTEEPVQDGERQVTVRRTGDAQIIVAAYHIPPGVHPDSAVVTLLGRILGDRATGRLHAALVETGKASDVSANDYALHDPGLAIFGARVPKGQPIEAAKEALLSTVEAPSFAPVTAAELERAKNAELRQVELTLRNSTRLGIRLSEWIGQGDWRLFFLQRDRIRAVKTADVDRVAAAYLKPANRTLGLFLPEEHPDRAAIPERPKPAELAAVLDAYKGDAAIAQGESFDPSPANVMARTTEKTLPGGLKLALLPKKTRGATVNAVLSLDFGDLASARGRQMVGSMVGQLLMRGTRHHSRREIEDEMGRLRAEIRVSGGVGGAFATIQTVRENLPAALRLVAEMLKEPTFPDSELAQAKKEAITRAEAGRSEPGEVARIALGRALNPYPPDHPSYVMTVDETTAAVQAVTRDQLVHFHDDLFGASDGQLAVVGDFDPAAVETLAGELFGSWKSPHGFARIPREYKDVAADERSMETPDKANASYDAGLNLPLRDDDPDYPALALANFLLGGSQGSRLEGRIREKEGLSYGVGSFFYAGDLDKAGGFGVYAICAPENMARLAADVREEMELARKDGFTDAEVAKAKAGYLAELRLRRARDGSLAGTLARYLFTGRTFAWDEALEARVAALTPAELQAALARHVDPARLVVVRAGDFAHAAGKPLVPVAPAAAGAAGAAKSPRQ